MVSQQLSFELINYSFAFYDGLNPTPAKKQKKEKSAKNSLIYNLRKELPKKVNPPKLAVVPESLHLEENLLDEFEVDNPPPMIRCNRCDGRLFQVGIGCKKEDCGIRKLTWDKNDYANYF
jgi:hypothetical protein